MPLSPGTRLGPYEIIAPLGAGGMGEVYRAHDSRLGRDVAVKVLPEHLSADPEVRARFEREAKTVSSLNHPNICVLHDVGREGEADYLVMELVEGETLAERLGRGALPPAQVLRLGAQIADALDRAHRAGVIHRDLKPGNVMLTKSGAKLMDFGLARATGRAGATTGGAATSGTLSQSPTIEQPLTTKGTILGTFQYMAPEQLEAGKVDERSDLWALGCVLYEMATGRRAFEGASQASVIGAILHTEPPPVSRLAPMFPRALERLVSACLAKDPAERVQSAHDVRLQLEWMADGVESASVAVSAPPAARHGRTARRWIVPAIAAALAMVATAAAFIALRPARPGAPVRRFRVPIEGLRTTYNSPLAFSRDGRHLAYEANDRIWVRRMDQLEAFEVPGSKGGHAPFWSWDQKSLGFAANKKLWTFTLGADQGSAICDIPGTGEIVGGAWGPDSRIFLAVWRGGLYEVPAAGGEVRPVVPLDSSMVDFHSPSFLPDGRALLLFVHNKGEASAVATLEGSPPRLKRVFESPKASMVSYSPSGHLLIALEVNVYRTATWAVPFSPARRSVTGPPFLVLDGASSAIASSDGLLAAAEDEPPPQGRLVWMRRDGSIGGAIGEPQPGLAMPSLSPDGGRVAYVAVQDGNADVWVGDLARGTRTRLTSSPRWEGSPVWSPDGSHLYYGSLGTVGADRIVGVDSDGGGAPDTLANGLMPSVSPDGKSLAYTVDRRGNADLWIVHLDRGNAAEPFLETPDNEAAPSISPDGHWLAYVSDESGRNEIYIRRYPQGDARAQVSVDGGNWPRWTRRGDAIYYVNRDTLTMVEVGPGPRPALGLPRALFAAPAGVLMLSGNFLEGWPLDAHPDGSRFIGVRRTASPATRALLFVENWFEEFGKR